MVYGEGIISRMPNHSALHNENNPFRLVFINTVGKLLDDFDVTESMEGVYLQSAEKSYLDLHGKDFNIKRKLNESDESYRNRIIYESLGHLTINYLLNIFEIPLYVKISDFNPNGMQLTSDNPYINDSGYMSFAHEEIQKILDNKFIIGEGITWLSP